MGTCAGAPLVWGTSVTESESIGKLYAKLNTPRTFRGMDFQTISERQRLLPSSSESYWQLAAAANIILSLDSGASYSRAMKENSMSNSVRIQYYLEQIEKANAEGRKSKSFEYSYYLDNFKKLAHAYESMTPDDFPEVAHVLYSDREQKYNAYYDIVFQQRTFSVFVFFGVCVHLVVLRHG